MRTRTRRAVCQLYVKTKATMFGRGRMGELEKYLTDIERVTSVYPLSDVAELQLRNDGTTIRGNYRYTALAFRELCQMLAAGITAFLPDLAGMTRRADSDRDSLVDGHLACDFFNKTAALRYTLLESCRVIRNEQLRVIEGFVGAKHKALDNQTLLQQAHQSTQLNADDNEFYAAALVGRRMLLWYRCREPIFVRTIGEETWRFYRGYYFCNGEARGTSVRGTSAIFTRQGACLAPYDTFGGRLAHIGRDFNRRLDKMFGKILAKALPIDQLYKGCDRLMATPMGFVGLKDKLIEERIEKLSRSLGELGVPLRVGKEIVDRALFGGRDSDRREPIMRPTLSTDTDGIFAQRTMFDVFCCLVSAARGTSTRRRENLEQAAYTMLAGEFAD